MRVRGRRGRPRTPINPPRPRRTEQFAAAGVVGRTTALGAQASASQ
jgi:hypothetical protein